jgi:hypothetical protein
MCWFLEKAECTDQAPQKRKGRPFPVSQRVASPPTSARRPRRPPPPAAHKTVLRRILTRVAQDSTRMVEVYWSMHALLSPPLSLPALVRSAGIIPSTGAAPSIHACKEGQGACVQEAQEQSWNLEPNKESCTSWSSIPPNHLSPSSNPSLS